MLQFYEKAKEMFSDLQVTDMGHKYLGFYFGRKQGKDKFVEEKFQEWMKDVEQLSDIKKRTTGSILLLHLWTLQVVELYMSNYSRHINTSKEA